MENYDYEEAKAYALRLLGGKDYTRRQLEEKLAGRTDPETAERAAQRMEELGLIDDLDYAMRCARDLIRLKHFSLRRAAQELRRRGVGEEAAEAALEQFAQDDPGKSIAGVLLRRFAGYEADEKIRRRAVGALRRLGYDYDDIRRVMAHLEEYTD